MDNKLKHKTLGISASASVAYNSKHDRYRTPEESYQRIFEPLKKRLPEVLDKQIQKLIG